MPERRDAAIRRHARNVGLLDRFVDGLGVRRVTPRAALKALVEAIESSDADPATVVVARAGARRLAASASAARLDLEDGGTLALKRIAPARFELGSPLPIGTHVLRTRAGRRERKRHVLAPPRTLAPTVDALRRRRAGRGGYTASTLTRGGPMRATPSSKR